MVAGGSVGLLFLDFLVVWIWVAVVRRLECGWVYCCFGFGVLMVYLVYIGDLVEVMRLCLRIGLFGAGYVCWCFGVIGIVDAVCWYARILVLVFVV